TLAVLAAHGARELCTRAFGRAGIASVALAGTALCLALWHDAGPARMTGILFTALALQTQEDAMHLRRIVAPEDSIAAVGIGALAYYGDRSVIDMVGLTDEHIAHRGKSSSRGLIAHQRYDSEYVLSRRPAFITLPATSVLFIPGVGTGFVPAVTDMRAQRGFREQYMQIRPGWYARRARFEHAAR
ncbi:MAG TPA: hypothetical protein VK524_10985, partial [Polyangiaceae bacterium]|nr:hypothetical protein [Polyangiaceae bacterium]